MNVEQRLDTFPRSRSGAPGEPPLVAHVIHRLQAGGMENGLINLINNLPAEKYRHAIVCLTESSSFANRIKADNVTVHELRKREGKDPGFYLRFWQTIRGVKPAILHTRNLGTLDLNLVAPFAGVPARIHGEHGWDIGDPTGSSAKYRRLRRFCDYAVNEYVAVSKNIDAWLQRSIGVNPGKVRQIYNGVDTERFSPEGEATALQGGNCDRPLVVGTVGRMDPIKNHVWLVEAISALVGQQPEKRNSLRLVLVGDGAERSRIESVIASAGLADLVKLAGMREDVPSLMRGMDIFVLPSVNEGISNTILEAMATGLPVIASDVGGNPELIEHGKTGCLVSPEDPRGLVDALRNYIVQKELRQAHGCAGRRLAVSKFSLQTMVDEYDRLYERHLGAVQHERVH